MGKKKNGKKKEWKKKKTLHKGNRIIDNNNSLIKQNRRGMEFG
jgi:hypothetical protein